MNVKAQVAMVMNLDKCIGCHTCSVTCKNTWTNRTGAEYMWFNNVETKPGVGYPKGWEDQERHRGGWRLRGGRLELRSGGPWAKLAHVFHNPDLPEVDDYYEPWTYDYENLVESRRRGHQPVARPRSLLTGRPMDAPEWGPNWEDDLAGAPQHAVGDPDLRGIEEQVVLAYEQAFMLYLPRVCEHCLNPACVAACPSGAMYKREEDGIVLVDQEACRGWRFCVSACPYKKTYFNWQTHKAEKCTFCYPRIESGLPTVCAESCVGRIRYLGVVLYDADRVREAASVPEERDLLRSQLSLFLDPRDPEVQRLARASGVPGAWIDAALRSPVYRMAVEWRVALPLHPEFRTLPMVWYVPPLSPLASHLAAGDATTADGVRDALDGMRIPVAYLANLLAAGDADVVRGVLGRLWALRALGRARSLGRPLDPDLLDLSGLTAGQMNDMARLIAVAKFEERFVVPSASRDGEPDLPALQGGGGLDPLLPRARAPRGRSARGEAGGAR